ncbi:zinc finger protein OZF [Folsomia candida]|uniref:zinc finger protein OZF n=1 Tax=Folsomia candida TaxID=158441 RepID=UPI000B90106B|nr:zinc finger protein OZF [Folsomia candida]XP_035700870.1 zinc finger protein OZF [Folsomia candida]
MDVNGGPSAQNETMPLDINETHRLGRQKTTVPTRKKGDRFQENGRLLPHSVQPRPTPRDVESPSANSRSSKTKKFSQFATEKMRPCKICLRPFTNTSSAHVHTHLNCAELDQPSFFHAKCPHCEKVFFNLRDFICHVNAHEGRKDPECRQKFTRKTNLTAHLFVDLNREERAEGWRHGCCFCQKRFKSPYHLSRHVLTHTKEKLARRCDICRKMLSSERTRTKHRFLHLSEDEKDALVAQGTSRECLFCGKKFPDNGSYHFHLGTHTEEKPFPCDECGAVFRRNCNLKSHMRIHSADLRPFKCDECGQGFSQKANVTSHKKTVHRKLKDIPCPECGKMFGTKSHVVEHVDNVHLKRRHPCPHCGDMFPSKSKACQHVRRVHPAE